MSNAAKHRKKAAEFEQLKQIDRAIASYVKAIEESEAVGEDVDVALYNKVGDLALRQGRVPDAITYYERAVEHYATSGLFNNAIALCNKILRSAPGRANVYFTLGRISARKGLRGDATRNFLEYATRMQQDGRIEEGIRALAEVLDLMPELNDVRTMVDDLAVRSGIALPRRRTPLRTDRVATPVGTDAVRDQKSQDLVFLDVDYHEAARRAPANASHAPTPPAVEVVPTTSLITPLSAALITPLSAALITPLDDFENTVLSEVPIHEEPEAVADGIASEIRAPDIVAPDFVAPDEAFASPLEGLEANGEFVDDVGVGPLDGFTPDEPVSGDLELLPKTVAEEVTWIVAPSDRDVGISLDEVVTEDYQDAANDPAIVRAIYTQTPAFVPTIVPDAQIAVDDLEIERLDVESVPELEEALAASEELIARAEAFERSAATPAAPISLVPTPAAPELVVLPPELLTPFVVEIDDVEEQLEPYRPPFRLDPHDFILPGELPPLVLEDFVVDAGITFEVEDVAPASARDAESASVDLSDTLTSTPLGSDVSVDGPVSASMVDDSASAAIIPEASATSFVEWVDRDDESDDESDDGFDNEGDDDTDDDADDDTDDETALDRDGEQGSRRPVSVTPALPIAAVAEAATSVASSRRDSLRAAVARLPQNWLLRRRLAEALFEAGERDAALAELETAQSGLVNEGEFAAASDIADELVHVSPDRVPYHQKRVELAVRANDQQRLRFAYLDLADALVRMAEEGRARAVYARVLEIDPYDDRARAALGAAAPPPPPVRPDDSFVDLADWLRDDDKPIDTRMRMREPAISGDEQADFDALLRHFKEGVSRSLGEDDFESHYDLGVAYKEMGLLDDAIAEFQKALRSRTHRLPAYEALGQCFVEQGRYQVAATVLSRALHEPGLDDDQRVGVLYLLAYSCEALQRRDEARSYFQRVYATDINFRDVAARLAALEQASR